MMTTYTVTQELVRTIDVEATDEDEAADAAAEANTADWFVDIKSEEIEEVRNG